MLFLLLLLLLQGGQYDFPVEGRPEQLCRTVGCDRVALGDVCAGDDERTAAPADPARVPTAFQRLLQSVRGFAENS